MGSSLELREAIGVFGEPRIVRPALLSIDIHIDDDEAVRGDRHVGPRVCFPPRDDRGGVAGAILEPVGGERVLRPGDAREDAIAARREVESGGETVDGHGNTPSA
jgi:hypothetical protein